MCAAQLTVVDMSGASRYKQLWECYYKECQAVVFVVDSASASAQLEENRDTLRDILRHKDLAKQPLLVFSNKSDLPSARASAEVAERLELTGEACGKRAWQMTACSALTGEGVDDGIKWLVGKV